MKNNESYRTAIEISIRKIFYHTEHTRTERNLLEDGWRREGPYWVDRSERNDAYGLLLQGINPIKISHSNPAEIL